MAPYKPGCMLLQVKGRRICQTRLVEPSKESVNSGDAYILVTPKEIFNWVGEFSNVIERSRSADVALTIYQKRDLGCKTARRVTTIEEEKVSSGHVFNKSFWSFLGCPEPPSKVSFSFIFNYVYIINALDPFSICHDFYCLLYAKILNASLLILGQTTRSIRRG